VTDGFDVALNLAIWLTGIGFTLLAIEWCFKERE
jgi:hypothetical protein